jgi:hypothetical protein
MSPVLDFATYVAVMELTRAEFRAKAKLAPAGQAASIARDAKAIKDRLEELKTAHDASGSKTLARTRQKSLEEALDMDFGDLTCAAQAESVMKDLYSMIAAWREM